MNLRGRDTTEPKQVIIDMKELGQGGQEVCVQSGKKDPKQGSEGLRHLTGLLLN